MFCAMCDQLVTGKTNATMKRYSRLGRGYCSRECSKAYQAKVSSKTMARTNEKYASERMIKNNPMRLESARSKMRQTLLDMNHKPKIRGGNGAPATQAEVKLMELLGPLGFVEQFAIATGMPRGVGPGHYKIDCANVAFKIAVEADGFSHTSLKRKASDHRKDEFLRGKGWTVHRFTNAMILDEPMTVMSIILKSLISTHTSLTGS